MKLFRHAAPMIAARYLLLFLFLLDTAAASAESSGPTCGLPEISGARELHHVLSMRSIELVERAAQPKALEDAQLASMVAPSATFELGGGDVGRPLGYGVSGAKALANTMNADTYRFLGWDYMDGPINACSPRTVVVEFVNTRAKLVSRVEFKFNSGHLVSAIGWQRSFETGLLKETREHH